MTAMVTLKFIHLLSVAIFLGSLACMHVVKIRSDRSNYDVRLLGACHQIDSMLVGPSAGVLTLSGAAMWYLAGDMLSSQRWIYILTVGWLICAGVGIGYLSPTLKWLASESSKNASQAYPTISRRWNRINGIVFAGLIVLLGVAVQRP